MQNLRMRFNRLKSSHQNAADRSTEERLFQSEERTKPKSGYEMRSSRRKLKKGPTSSDHPKSETSRDLLKTNFPIFPDEITKHTLAFVDDTKSLFCLRIISRHFKSIIEELLDSEKYGHHSDYRALLMRVAAKKPFSEFQKDMKRLIVSGDFEIRPDILSIKQAKFFFRLLEKAERPFGKDCMLRMIDNKCLMKEKYWDVIFPKLTKLEWNHGNSNTIQVLKRLSNSNIKSVSIVNDYDLREGRWSPVVEPFPENRVFSEKKYISREQADRIFHEVGESTVQKLAISGFWKNIGAYIDSGSIYRMIKKGRLNEFCIKSSFIDNERLKSVLSSSLESNIQSLSFIDCGIDMKNLQEIKDILGDSQCKDIRLTKFDLSLNPGICDDALSLLLKIVRCPFLEQVDLTPPRGRPFEPRHRRALIDAGREAGCEVVIRR